MILDIGVGGCSFACMKKILLILADLMMHSNGDASGANHVSYYHLSMTSSPFYLQVVQIIEDFLLSIQ